MNLLRKPSHREFVLVSTLLQGKPETVHFLDAVDELLVKPMSDGGMGSLSLVPSGLEDAMRTFGKQLVLGEFTDSDGISVSVAINVDSQGQLYELDVWKVNFAPLLRWPDPADVRIVG